jgi:hypothetical protein
MFISSPISLFMNCSASQPAIPPMMIAAIQPTAVVSMAALPEEDAFHHEVLMTRMQACRGVSAPIGWTVIETAARGYVPQVLRIWLDADICGANP